MFAAMVTARFQCTLGEGLLFPCAAVLGLPFGVFGHAPCCVSPFCFRARGQKPHAPLQTEKHHHLQDHSVCTGCRDVLSVPLGEKVGPENIPAFPASRPAVRKAALSLALRTMGPDCEFGLSLEACGHRSPLLHPCLYDSRAAAALSVECDAAAADGDIVAADLTDAVHVDAALFVLGQSAYHVHAADAADDAVLVAAAAADAAVVVVAAADAVAADAVVVAASVVVAVHVAAAAKVPKILQEMLFLLRALLICGLQRISKKKVSVLYSGNIQFLSQQ